jgi:hypothetical protein
MGSPFPNQQPGNSLSRKARTRREKWGGASINWKIIPTGTWHKAVFSIIARKNVTSHCRFFKQKKKKKDL